MSEPSPKTLRPPMTARQWLTGKILVLEFAGFLLMLLIIWLDEFFDLESHLNGVPPKPIDWFHFLLESGSILVLMAVVTTGTYLLLRQIKRLESFIMVCAWCKKVRYKGQWISLERYLRQESEGEASHGMCPECFARETGEESGK